MDFTVVLETAPATELCGAANEPLALVCSLHFAGYTHYVHTCLNRNIDSGQAHELLFEGSHTPLTEPTVDFVIVARHAQPDDIANAHTTACTGPHRTGAFTEAHEMDFTVVLETAPATELCGAANEPLALVCSLHFAGYTHYVQDLSK